MDIKKDIISEIKKITGSEKIVIEIPPDPNMGDYAFPCFSLSKEMKKSPAQIAGEIKNDFPKKEYLEKIEIIGPYLNLFLKIEKISSKALGEIISKKEKFGIKKKIHEKVMIEFSQANTHKAFHVGHLRGTSLGESLSRILKHSGFDVIKANYQGDTGMHVAKWIWNYLNYHKKEDLPKKDIEKWIAGIYVDAVKKLEKNKDLEKEVEDINNKLENKSDKEIMEIWKKTRKLSLDSFEKIYQDLDVSFDECFFEREMENDAKTISLELLKRKIAKKDQGAVIIDLEKYNLGIWVLLRKDSTTLYSSKDIALAKKKFEKFRISRNIYVVGMAQSLHLKQLFKTLELMGYETSNKCQHLAFAEVRLPTGQMSSRTGENILYHELKEKLFSKAFKEVKKRHPDWTQKKSEKSAFNITIGAIKFEMLKQDSNKNIVFDIDKSLDFEGETGPYIQYAHARICSILRKNGKINKKADLDSLKEKQEKILILQLMKFPQAIDEISKNLKVNTLAHYVLKTSQMFNEYYHKHKVLDDDKKIREARIILVECVRQVIENCLYLLAIPAPEEM